MLVRHPTCIALLALSTSACQGWVTEPDGPQPVDALAVDAGSLEADGGDADAGPDAGTPRDAGTAPPDAGPPPPVVIYSGWPFDSNEAARRQTQTAAALRLAPEVDIDLGGSVTLTMVVIPAGQSTLGCTDAPFPGIDAVENRCEGDERLHAFVLSKPLLLGKTAFTVAQFNALAPELPDAQTPLPGLPGLPARLPYRRVQDVIRLAVQKHAPPGWVVRLPSVDEWEYAARAGVVSFFTTGNAEADLAQTAWYRGNSGGVLHEVGLKLPNAWRLHDVIGNSWSWIWVPPGDIYGDGEAKDHLVRSCPFSGAALWNECRLSNRMISSGGEAFRLAVDLP